MNLARAVQVSMDTAVQPCEDRKSHLVDFVGRRVVSWVFSGAVSRNPRVVFARRGLTLGWLLCLLWHGVGQFSSCLKLGLHGWVNAANMA